MQYIRTSRLHVRYKHLESYRLFLYEDLLADPERTTRELCEFVGIEFSTGKLQLGGCRLSHLLKNGSLQL
jgi:hypothetical protein